MDTLFSKHDIDTFIRNRFALIESEVESLDENYLLTVSESDLVNALVKKLQLSSPRLSEPKIAHHGEVQSLRSPHAHERATYRLRSAEIIVHIPFHGDEFMFTIGPSQFRSNPPRANLRSGFLELVLHTEGSSGEELRQRIDKFVESLHFYLSQLDISATAFNAELPLRVQQLIQLRKRRILDRHNLVSSIGLGLLRRDVSSKTYSIPNVRKSVQVPMPQAAHKPFVPEPELAESDYEDIMTIVRNMVRVMEASPRAFTTMNEEDLRQHFLVQLNGQYQGRATGETFNYEGKTDILIRENERNVFIGECKFWKGPDSLTKTIDQCLGYLHWRDTKAAIFLFNRNKDFSNVLAEIEPTAKAHPGFKRLIRQAGETEWRFVFANKDDPNREVHLAILAFDIPKAP